jgi:signal transduction histidine kinase/PAS domain-containing protein
MTGPVEPLHELKLSVDGHEFEAADALAAVTARAAGAPAAMIHIVDGARMRLMGGRGLPPGWHVEQRPPTSATLAGVVIRGGDPLIVTDLRDDARVPAEAWARDAGIRSYAGFGIRDPDGAVVGVCAALDYRPRKWTPEQLTGVADGARACAAFVAQRRTAAAADATRRFLDALLETLPVGVAAVNAAARVVFTNAAIREMVGAPPAGADLAGWVRGSPVDTPDGRPLAVDEMPLARALRGEPVHDLEIRADRPGERVRRLLIEALPITGGGATLIGAVLAAQDVTDLRRAQRFRACELAVAGALNESGGLDDAGPTVLIAITDCLGWPRAELWLRDEQAGALRPAACYQSPRHPRQVAVPDRRIRGEGLVGRTWQADEPVWVRETGADPSTVRAARAGLPTAVAVPVAAAGQVEAVLALFAGAVEDPEDVLVALLQGVAAQIGEFLGRCHAHEVRRALTRSSEEYVALVGHELRTPMAVINSYAEMLLDPAEGDLSPDTEQMVAVVRRQSRQVLHIIDELLDLAALESGHTPMGSERCDLAALAREAAADLYDTAAAAGLTLRTDLALDCPVRGDTKRLRQVVDTLLGNAIAYSPDGGRIALAAGLSGGVVELTVTDPGIGIPDDERDRMFSRFYRSSRTRERRIPGAGLALAVGRAIVERHDGCIRLLPAHDQGTTIQVRLPADCRAEAGSPAR